MRGAAEVLLTIITYILVFAAALQIGHEAGQVQTRADTPPISALEQCEQERAAWKGRYQRDPRSMWAGEVPRDEGGR